MTTIKLKNGSGAPAASDLVQGEPALDLTNKRLYSEDASGNVIEVGTNPTALTVDTDTLVVDASNGNVGVGESSPSFLLHVKETPSNGAYSSTANIDPTARFHSSESTTGSYTAIQLAANNGNSTLGWWNIGSVSTSTNYDNHLVFQTRTGASSYAERMRIDSSGNVGIGTLSPASMAGGTSTNPVLSVGGTDDSLNTVGDRVGSISFISSDLSLTNTFSDGVAGEVACITDTSTGGGNALAFYTANTGVGRGERMRISGGGNVGIGTTTLDSGLVVHGSNAASRIHISSSSNGKQTFDGSGSGVLLTAQNMNTTSKFTPAIQFGSRDDQFTTANPKVGAAINGISSESYSGDDKGGMELAFYTAPNTPGTAQTVSERMRIDNAGNLLVGTTNTSKSSGTGVKIAQNSGTNSLWNVGVMGDGGAGDTGFTLYDTAYRFYVTYAGSIFATSTSITAISDVSLKQNIRDLDKGLDTINALQPRLFDWKNGDGNDIMGFVAQEVETIFPELVHEYKYTENETKKALKMGDMIPSMVKAIQELSAQVNELKAEVAALKGA